MGEPNRSSQSAVQMKYDKDVNRTKVEVFQEMGNIFGIWCENNTDPSTGEDNYLLIFDQLEGDVTVGTTEPDWSMRIPKAGIAGKDVVEVALMHCKLGCTIAVAQNRDGSGDPSAAATVSVWYVNNK